MEHLFDYAVENIADPKGRGLLYCFLRCTLLTGRAASNLIHRDCAGILAGTACGTVPALTAGRDVNGLTLLSGGLFLRCLLSRCSFGGCLFLRSLFSGSLFSCLLLGCSIMDSNLSGLLHITVGDANGVVCCACGLAGKRYLYACRIAETFRRYGKHIAV